MIVVWDDTVSLPDAEVDKWGETVVKSGQKHVRIGTGTMLNAIRLHVIRGNLSHEDVEFQFGEDTIYVNKEGRLDHWPDGFADIYDRQLVEICRL